MKRLGEGRNLDRVRVKGDHIPWGLVQLAHVRLQRNRTTLYAGRRRRGRQGRGEQKRGKLGVLADPHNKTSSSAKWDFICNITGEMEHSCFGAPAFGFSSPRCLIIRVFFCFLGPSFICFCLVFLSDDLALRFWMDLLLLTPPAASYSHVTLACPKPFYLFILFFFLSGNHLLQTVPLWEPLHPKPSMSFGFVQLQESQA